MSKPDLLYLAHRIPYPPNKGDKLRSFHFLKYLSEHFNIHLGCFYDDPQDSKYIKDLDQFCQSTLVLPLSPMFAKIKSARGLVSGKALTLEYYSNGQMQDWADSTIHKFNINQILVFSSAMAPYVEKYNHLRRVIDFIDIDSDKWTAYSETKPWPLSWVYKREGFYLAKYEKKIAKQFSASCFVSEAEATHFSSNDEEIRNRTFYVNNGVDYQYFSPSIALSSPFDTNTQNIVFTGAMDYWPNIDAVCWFTKEFLPEIKKVLPEIKLFIVGSNPSEKVKSLALTSGIIVTGRVEDIRPYILHADVILATLRIARGVQNKVLEAMAFNKPVLVTDAAIEGIIHGGNIQSFNTQATSQMISHTIELLHREKQEITYRQYIKDHYDWKTNTEKLYSLLQSDSTSTISEN